MLITRIKIANYKNLKDIEFSFEGSGGLAVFVGCNGCGKSNLLEAISLIAEDIGSTAHFKQAPFKYELEYIDSNDVKCEVKRSLGAAEIDVSGGEARGISVIGLYNGDFARIKPGICAEAKDLPAAILLYLHDETHPFALSEGIVSKKCATFVSCVIDDNGEFDPSEGPQSEMEDLYVNLLNQTDSEGRIRMPFATFDDMVQVYTGENPQNYEDFIFAFLKFTANIYEILRLNLRKQISDSHLSI